MHAVRTNRIHYHALLSLDARVRNGNIKHEQYTSEAHSRERNTARKSKRCASNNDMISCQKNK